MTPHFTVAEMACRCGCGRLPSLPFVQRLEELRVAFNRPMPVTSGARCPAYNATVSLTGEDGPHTKDAVDVAVSRRDAYDLMVLAPQFGFTGIGFKQHGGKRYVHLDALPSAPGQPRPTLWSYP
jgi:peptidase M15-like protein